MNHEEAVAFAERWVKVLVHGGPIDGRGHVGQARGRVARAKSTSTMMCCGRVRRGARVARAGPMRRCNLAMGRRPFGLASDGRQQPALRR